MTDIAQATSIKRLKFPPEIERLFQENYYSQMRGRLRVGIWLLVLLSFLIAIFHEILASGAKDLTLATIGLVGVTFINIVLVWGTFRKEFVTCWQTLVVTATLAELIILCLTSNSVVVTPFLVLTFTGIQCLQFRWRSYQLLGVLGIWALATVWSVITHSRDAPPFELIDGREIVGFIFAILFWVTFSLWRTRSRELSTREDFLTRYLLTQERNQERQKREQTEQMLHVLSQAIGGIVHDLGNPLTVVQGGADTLKYFMQDEELDRKTIQEFIGMIDNGAQMLNYLRLSLMEQLRVLEGKTIPVELKSTSLQHLIQAGTQFQKPRFLTGRSITHAEDDLQVCVDEMRFITIFMNLIGNALKYSDGDVRVNWRIIDQWVLVAVLDKGQQGKGISKDQAERLFVPFGRLSIHAQIEGTGLGLLSVRKIAEAHEGEVYVEGCENGTVNSKPFSTAQTTFPSLLEDNFLTAFVVACPLKSPV